MRLWRSALGVLLLLWLVGTAYFTARRRGRPGLAFAAPLLGFSALCYLTAILAPRPPVTTTEATIAIVCSLLGLASAIGLIVWQGLR